MVVRNIVYIFVKNNYDDDFKSNKCMCLSYEDWYVLNEEEINIELSENGDDREMCFGPEKEFGDRYEKYLENEGK